MSRLTPARLIAGGAALLAALLAEASARAGIVVLENGHTIVGKIDPRRDVTLDEVVIHDPEGVEGTFPVPRRDVRWFDAVASAPTSEYWRRFHDDEIEPRWHASRARHDQAERDRAGDFVGVTVPKDPLGPRLQHEHFDLFGPLGWFATTQDGVTMVVGPAGPSGFKPRLHVFASPTPSSATPAEPLAWIEGELDQLSPDEAEFSIEELNRPRVVAGGADHELVTRTDVVAGPGRAARTVRAVRRISIRADWTVVAAGYADARDWDAVEPVLRRALGTLRVR